MLQVWGPRSRLPSSRSRVTKRERLEKVQTAIATAPRWLIGEVAGILRLQKTVKRVFDIVNSQHWTSTTHIENY